MITVRPNHQRGHTELSWLDSRHTFSFDRYYDPRHMGFRHLRVINEDRVKPGASFGIHSHRDMEIVTYVLEGALEHRDSMGNRPVIRPSEVQRMSAGTGISHSEYNASPTEPVHFLQIWILPEKEGVAPSYEQRAFAVEENRGRLIRIAGREGSDGALSIHQDVDLYAAVLAPGEQVAHQLRPHRHAWVQVARGAITLNGIPLAASDGAAISEEKLLEIKANDLSEILLFDLA